jgi:DNA-binding transcriptional regulator YiaG
VTGPELKKLRQELGLSIAKAARQVEVSARTWARWEAGNQSIPEGAVKLFRILNKLDEVK